MPASVTLKALGLNTSPNQLDVPAGSMIEASNVIINNDSIISQRRGFSIYGDSFGSSSDRAKQLISYRDRIIRHFSNQLEFDTGTQNTSGVEIFDLFDGTYSETEPGLRIKSVESNGNLYFTTAEGIKKISAKTADDLTTNSGFITQAGGIKAVDFIAKAIYQFGDQTDFLPQDSTVAYRILWLIRDKNNNLIAGTPSQRAEVFNSLLTLELQDLGIVLGNLDNINQTGSMVTNGDYASTLFLPLAASASELRLNLIALATKLDNDIRYADESSPGSYPLDISAVNVTSNVVTITFATGDPTDYFVTGSKVEISGFVDSATASLDGTFSLTAVTPTTISYNKTATNGAGSFTASAFIQSNEYRSISQPAIPSTPPTDDELVALQTYLSAIITRLQNEPVAVISAPLAAAYIDILDVTTASKVHLDITIPPDITSDYFFQIYRSDISQATGTTVLADLTANDEMKLVYEAFPTAAELAAKEISVDDITPDIFRGANLYTNEATGEGIAQANDVPPFAKDINRFKNVTFYANTKTRQRKLFSLLGVVNMIRDFGTGLNSHTFVGAAVNTSTDTITISTHGYTDGQAIEFSNPTPSNLPGGITQSLTYYILNSTTNTFQISTVKFGTSVDITTIGTGTHTVRNQLPKLVISNGVTTNVYTFVVGVQEQTQIETVAGSALAASGTASYFFINSANNDDKFYVWYKIGTATDPMIAGKTGIPVLATAADTDDQIATKTSNTLGIHISDFTTSVSTNFVTVTNTSSGYTDDATAETSTFTITILRQGVGEDVNTNQILLSDLVSVGQAVDETARSLVRVINKNPSEIISAFYLSASGGVPGQMLFEERVLSDLPFYMLGNNLDTGISFSPAVDPTNFIVSNSVANPTVITSSSPHGLQNGDKVTIVGSNSTPSIDGLWPITFVSSTTFSIPVNVTVAGVGGSFIKAGIGVFSDNEKKPNRIYYSKLQQPEAVPLVNFIDVGSQDRQILRIFPLRDSLFVFKEDGLFRISGENAPFVTALFDSSCILLAPDSVSVSNNLVYGWTTQGISTVSESGVDVITRNIKNIVLKLASDNFPGFKTSTWGIGYESDNSYIVYTVKDQSDTSAQIGYRYDQITTTWTSIDKDYTCGVIHHLDDKLYVGAGDTNFIEKERKEFNRYDYADRELPFELVTGQYFDTFMKFLSDVSKVTEGDVLIQEQLLTIYQFNQTLKKLDIDAQIVDSDYFSDTVFGSDIITGPSLGEGEKYATLSGSTVTNTGFSVITGDLGVSPGSSITGFPPGTVSGDQHSNDASAIQAQSDVSGAYINLQGRTPTQDLSGQDLGTIGTLTPGVYSFSSSAQLTGNLFLDAQDDPNGLFIFQIGSTLTTASSSSVSMINSGKAGNVYWQVGSSATLGTGTVFLGNILAQTSITMNTGASIAGRAIALTSAVTLDTNIITRVPSPVPGGLQAIPGDSMRAKIVALAKKLDADAGVNDEDYFSSIDTQSGFIQNISIANPTIITTTSPHNLQEGRVVTISGSNSVPNINGTYPVSIISASAFSVQVDVDMTAGTTGTFATIDTDFRDIQACYNFIINKLNLDTGVNFSNYQESVGTTIQESIVTSVNNVKKEIHVNLALPYVQGPLIIFKAIPTSLTYSAITFDDPLTLKHIREFTMIFANKAFTTAKVSFASDLLPEFKPVPVLGDGNGIFGYSGNMQGFGSGFFGGGSHGAPFRTYVPAEKQMCVYLTIKFEHHIAREIFEIYGITLVGETGISSRAYR